MRSWVSVACIRDISFETELMYSSFSYNDCPAAKYVFDGELEFLGYKAYMLLSDSFAAGAGESRKVVGNHLNLELSQHQEMKS